MFFYRSIAYIFLYSIVSIQTIAQTEKKDSLLISTIQETATNRYYTSIKENAPFYNGSEYTGHGQNLIGHAFFGTGNAYNGYLEYDGVVYSNVSMQYDIVEDAIIIRDFTKNYFIRLNSKKIGSFSLYGQLFIQPSFYEKNGNAPEEGFFQQLYKGSTSVLAKRKKKLSNKQGTEEKNIGRFLQFDSYFIKKGNDYLAISRKKDIIQAYADKKNEIRKFIGDHAFSFRKQPDDMLIKVAAYYDQLKK